MAEKWVSSSNLILLLWQRGQLYPLSQVHFVIRGISTILPSQIYGWIVNHYLIQLFYTVHNLHDMARGEKKTNVTFITFYQYPPIEIFQLYQHYCITIICETHPNYLKLLIRRTFYHLNNAPNILQIKLTSILHTGS